MGRASLKDRQKTPTTTKKSSSIVNMFTGRYICSWLDIYIYIYKLGVVNVLKISYTKGKVWQCQNNKSNKRLILFFGINNKLINGCDIFEIEIFGKKKLTRFSVFWKFKFIWNF